MGVLDLPEAKFFTQSTWNTERVSVISSSGQMKNHVGKRRHGWLVRCMSGVRHRTQEGLRSHPDMWCRIRRMVAIKTKTSTGNVPRSAHPTASRPCADFSQHCSSCRWTDCSNILSQMAANLHMFQSAQLLTRLVQFSPINDQSSQPQQTTKPYFLFTYIMIIGFTSPLQWSMLKIFSSLRHSPCIRWTAHVQYQM